MKFSKLGAALVGAYAAMAAGMAQAQVNNPQNAIAAPQSPTNFVVGGATFNIYGNADIYMNYMRSSSGKQLGVLEEGGIQRTRIGLRGEKPVDNGFAMKFNLEQALNLLNGSQGDANRLFDRQAWVGVATPIGEFRAGRQQTIIMYRGMNYVDYTGRNLGSVVQAFGNPVRYDSDLAYISPRIAGFLFEGHVSLNGAQNTTNDTANQSVYQLGVDWNVGPYRLGYAGLAANAPGNSTYHDHKVRYDNYYANYDYGRGKVYLAFVRSNNMTAANGINNAGSILSNVGGNPTNVSTGLVAGNDANVLNYYNIYQISADYKVTPKLRVGALWGRIDDTTDNGRNATGGSVGAFYDIWQDTTVYALAEELRNDTNAGFRWQGSAALPTNFTNGADVNGKTIRGAQLGVIYKF